VQALTTVEQSAHEQLSLANGSLGFSLPVVSFPQRGGGSLNLALVYSSSETFALKEVSRTMGLDCGNYNLVGGTGCFGLVSAHLGWVNNSRGPWSGSVHPNLPNLNADLVYAGDNSTPYPCGQGTCYTDVATYCLTNWVFTDWSGSTHPFWGRNNCSNSASFLPYMPNGGDASDGSGYQYDLTNQNDPIVRGPDGTIYHFPAQPRNTVQPYVQYNSYSHVFTSIVDRNGNTITASGAGVSYVVTDTMGRQITVSNGDFSWSEQSTVGAQPIQRKVTTSYGSSGDIPSPFPANDTCNANSVRHPDGTGMPGSFCTS
jgi:hypothetical protein